MCHSVRYRILHHTQYRYSEPVAICQNQLRMLPRSFVNNCARIYCHEVNIHIDPVPDTIRQHEDYFGNVVYGFSIESLHRELSVQVESELTVAREPLPKLATPLAWDAVVQGIVARSDPNWYEAQEYCFNSPRIRSAPLFANYASSSFLPGRDIVESMLELTKRIHDDFRYDVTATDVNTPTEKAFELQAGVCQDFAHVQIACLRSIGLPTKYVSGYLQTVAREGQPRLVGADESHAWISAYLGPQYGWVDFDPTNACRCSTDHIPICVGRDYSEVSPMRGVVLGGGKPQLKVSVDVEPLAD